MACNFHCNIWCHAAVFCRNYRKIYFLLLHVNQGKRIDQLKLFPWKLVAKTFPAKLDSFNSGWRTFPRMNIFSPYVTSFVVNAPKNTTLVCVLYLILIFVILRSATGLLALANELLSFIYLILRYSYFIILHRVLRT